MMKRKPPASMRLILGMAVTGILLAGLLAGVAAAQDWQGYAEGWLNAGYYDAGYQQQYYPYFGEEFFSSNSRNYSQQAIEAQRQRFEAPFLPYFGERFLFNSRNYSQQAIEAERQRFEAPFLPYFGEGFFSRGEPYQFTYPGPWGVFPVSQYNYYQYPYYYQYPWMNRPLQPWPEFQKNWTQTLDYARSNSSFRIYSSGTWRAA